MLRPQACRWFELVAVRDELASALALLAQSGAVELQSHDRRAPPFDLEDTAPLWARYHELARDHRAHWPAPADKASIAMPAMPDPRAALQRRLAQIEAWCQAAEPLLVEREQLLAQRRALADLHPLVATDGAASPAAALLAGPHGSTVVLRHYLLPAGSAAPDLTGTGALCHALPTPDGELLTVLSRAADITTLDARVAALKGRRVEWPDGLAPDAGAWAARDAHLQARDQALRAQLDAWTTRHELPAALADIALIGWLQEHGADVGAGARLVWITGWTCAHDPEALCAPLHDAGVRCVARLDGPPPGLEPPSVLVNPPWSRAFETFVRMLGQPGRDEADPSPVAALIAPLLFGFMFGDVGQGAVLMLAGWWLRGRVPTLALLVPGGAMAMVFGLAFGSVFAREDLIPAAWLHPLAHPVDLLAASVALGALILLGGLLLQALQAHWRGRLHAWWGHEAGLVLAYLGGLCALAASTRPAAGWLLAAGGAWYAWGAGPGWRDKGTGLAQFVEHAMQLAVNTVSFARVGAFALAHAGLSVAVVGVAEAVGGVGQAVVMVLGNLLILLLEGLVVGIQTTRLLLFEFFVRFVQGGGRAFRPLPPPWAPWPVRSPKIQETSP